MKAESKQNRAWLLATAKAVAQRLKLRSEGTHLRIRIPSRSTTTNTDGWNAIIGDLGKGQARLEVWFDRFSGYSERKLWACFTSYRSRPPIMAITKRVSQALWPVRTLTLKDTQEGRFFALSNRLSRAEFNLPVLEQYDHGETFYGSHVSPTQNSVQLFAGYRKMGWPLENAAAGGARLAERVAQRWKTLDGSAKARFPTLQPGNTPPRPSSRSRGF